MIALGRLFMAALFLVAVWLELGNPTEAPPATAILAIAYMFFAAAILVATWNSWWLDARLAGAAHALDIAMFTLMVLLTHGYTSPFFTFFMFLLLSAAIRWGWKATALTGDAGDLALPDRRAGRVKPAADFELQRFLVRTGHLVILSLILIWFGINQWRSRFSLATRAAGQSVAGRIAGRGRPARRDRAVPRIARSLRLVGARAATAGLRPSFATASSATCRSQRPPLADALDGPRLPL